MYTCKTDWINSSFNNRCFAIRFETLSAHNVPSIEIFRNVKASATAAVIGGEAESEGGSIELQPERGSLGGSWTDDTGGAD